MPQCAACESLLAAGAEVCGVCGTHTAHVPTKKAGADQARGAIESARRALEPEESRSGDVSAVKRLLDAAERAVEGSNYPRAVDMARAAKRAVEIAHRRSRVDAEIARADLRLKGARDVGVDTQASEKSLRLARDAAAKGALTEAEKVLRRVSVKALEVRREKRFQSLYDRAAHLVAHAKERAGNVERAEDALQKARKAAAGGSFDTAKKHVDAAAAGADHARKHSRAESYVMKAQSEAEAARKAGAELTETRQLLSRARDALRRDVYADVQKYVQLARVGIREAKRLALAEAPIRIADHEVRKEERRKTNVLEPLARLEAARAALKDRDYPRVRVQAQEALDLTKEAAHLRRLGESLVSLSYDSEDLRKIGADSNEFDLLVKDAKGAVSARDLATAKRYVALARRSAEHAREARYREVVRTSVETIVTRAGEGKVDAAKARTILAEIEEALADGRVVDVAKLLEERLEVRDVEQIQALSTEASRIWESLVDLRRANIEITGGEQKIGAARAAAEAGRFKEARKLLGEIDELIRGLQDALRASADEMVTKARNAIQTAGEQISVPDAVRILENAEESLAQKKYPEALEFGRIALSRAEWLIERHREELARRGEDDQRKTGERVRAVRERFEAARTAVDAIESDFVEVTAAREALANAQRAFDSQKLEEAEAYIAAAEDIRGSLFAGLKSSAEGGLDTARKLVADAKEQGLSATPAEELLPRAEQALFEQRYSWVLEAVQAIEAAIAEARKARTAEERKLVLDRSKRATDRLLRIRQMLEELHKADIEIQGSDEMLRKAEGAIQRRDFDRVDVILEDVEDTARELKGELTAAANEIVRRARGRIEEAKALGLDTSEPTGILASADAYFEQGQFDDAVEFALSAEQRAAVRIREHHEEVARQERKRREAARGAIERMKKQIDDLSRADIEIIGAKEFMTRAEQALEAGNYDVVHTELDAINADVESVRDGLKAAAEDLVAMATRAIEEAKSEGFKIPRAESVLANAQEAIKDIRYVEAIEYKKVIEDIIDDARRQRARATIERRMKVVRLEFEETERSGAEVRAAAELLRQAEEEVSEGRLDHLESFARRIEESLAAAWKEKILLRLTETRKAVERGEIPGFEKEGIDGLERRTERAAETCDIKELGALLKEVEERVSAAETSARLARATAELGSIRALVEEADSFGIDAQEVRALLADAERATEQGDLARLEQIIGESAARLEDARERYLTDRHGAKLRGIAAMIASARRVGADIEEAEELVGKAEAALLRNDVMTAEMLIKEAEISTGAQVQNFIKNRYPNLVFHLPSQGLQADVWNLYTFEVENKGTLAARNVDLKIHGDVEVKGLLPISEIGVDERAVVEVGLKPKAEGKVPMEVAVSYQRYFDENRYEARNEGQIQVDSPGTYLVEDVFLIHSDGRLLAHESRKFREQIDEDIFSGMLTVVQDFVRDSFRQRTRVGLRRLDFGDSKILIERSSHAFLACVLIGDEPSLLPLYMIEVLKEVEERFGTVLERWNGMLHEIHGVEESIRKLILVTKVTAAEVSAWAGSPVTSMARSLEIARQSGQDVTEVEALLSEATKNLEKDLETAWQFINAAKERATVAEGQVHEQMGELLTKTRGAIEELRSLGADVSQAELLLREADELRIAGKFDRVREIAENVRSSLGRAKSQVESRKVESELSTLVSGIREGRALGIDVREAESYLPRIEEAIQRKDQRRLEECLRRAFESIDRNRRKMVLGQARKDTETLARMVSEAAELNIDVGDTERYLELADQAFRKENVKDLEILVAKARTEARLRITDQLRDRHPRLFVGIPFSALEAGAWNRAQVEVANKGNVAAKDLNFAVVGEFEVAGLPHVAKLDVNERLLVGFGVRPKAPGAATFDVQVKYRRPLDENWLEVTDSKEIQVEEPGTYPVTDALAFHRDGTLLAHERREFQATVDRPHLDPLVESIRSILPERRPENQGLRRATAAGIDVFIQQGPHEYLVVVVRGEEPRGLPLYMIEILKQVEDEFGHRLSEWNGDLEGLEGLATVIRKLLSVTGAEGADLGPLEGSVMSQAVRLAESGGLTGEGGEDFLAYARDRMEREPYPKAVGIVDWVTKAVAAPAADLARQVREAAEVGRQSGMIAVTEEELSLYTDVVRRTLEAVSRAKAKAGIDRHWPVKRLAVKAKSQEVYDAVQSFRKLVVAQSLTKELDVVAKNEMWRGMKVQVHVDRDLVSAAYKVWARKIEILLKSQDPWKIKAGLSRDEYAVGIDGQRVRIDPKMVTFTESVPEHVIQEPYDDGVVYLDTEMTPEILGEGYAKELVNVIKDMRKDLRLTNEGRIETRIRTSEKAEKLLKPWTDFITRETNSIEVQIVQDPFTDGYIVEATLGEENFLISVKAAAP